MSITIWIVLALVIIAACAGSGKGKHTGTQGKPTRIDHPHVMDPDDHECSVCGRRFTGNQTACPYCGVRFADRKTDYEEFDEEEEEMEAWDEEEGL